MFYIHTRCKYHPSRLLGRRVTSVTYISMKSHWDAVVNGWWELYARQRPSRELLFQLQPQNLKSEICTQVPSGPLNLAPSWKQSGLLMLISTREIKQEQASRLGAFIPGLSFEYGQESTAATDSSHLRVLEVEPCM